MRRPISGTVTFLFTDIQGSAERWEREPEAMREALNRHDVILRQVIESHGGHVFKTVGDAFCAVFDLPLEAVSAALEVQSLLQRGSNDFLELPSVRIALHTGSADERQGDYFGPTVNRVARIRDVAHGGQTLLSHATYELIRDALPPGTAVVDLGKHRLKDLERPEEVYQVDHPDLPGEFPPLRSLDIRAHNLPVQLTSFIGRKREMSVIQDRLTEVRLLTLIGAGGTGKTRLALQLGAELIDEYPDGVWLIELASLRDPMLVPLSLAKVLHLREQPGHELAETLTRHLQGTRTLLILDNCEHVLDACATIADQILQASQDVRILATSREPLGVSGEALWPVPPLSLLDPRKLSGSGKVSHLEAYEAYEAIRLFADRAQLGQPRFRLNDRNAREVAEICWRLDGIPLAIELAAARIRSLPIDQILARLSDRFALLTGGSRTSLRRHQTLRAAMDWSHDSLSSLERALFRRLSVFVGGWSLAAAEAVAPDAPKGLPTEGLKRLVGRTDIVDLLSQLVDKSLVLIEEVDDDLRYRFFETIREYACEQLKAIGEEQEFQSRHRDFFLSLAEEAYGNRLGPDRVQWIERLVPEEHNFRTAIEWSFEVDVNVDIGLRMATAVQPAWFHRGMIVEVMKWVERGLSAPYDLHPSTRLRALVARAWGIQYRNRKHEQSEKLASEALELATRLEDRGAMLETTVALANIAAERASPGLEKLCEDIVLLASESEHTRYRVSLLCS
jgi:predicted ATPase/class 3 adenylate cyclase